MDETFMLPAAADAPELFVRHQSPSGSTRGAVLYVHGATFPSGLSIAHRFDGRSWLDELVSAGFDGWGFDFAGYGHSGRYPEMSEAPEGQPPLGRVPAAVGQLERVVTAVRERSGHSRLSLVAHSWGTMVAASFASQYPDLVDRLVFFGPIARRTGGEPSTLGAWYPLAVDAQHQRFVADVPPGRPPVLLDRHFQPWAEAYLATDPTSRERTPPTVHTPSGPLADIAAAHQGNFPYDPATVRAPVSIVRGEWDSLCTDADARWLYDALSASPLRRDVKISAATHLMHLEEGRYALYRETEAFLGGRDLPPAPASSEQERSACSS
jgi:pimeloyl-ACP methyl ester carboxylesterase